MRALRSRFNDCTSEDILSKSISYRIATIATCTLIASTITWLSNDAAHAQYKAPIKGVPAPAPAAPAKSSLAPGIVSKLAVKMKRNLTPKEKQAFVDASARRSAAIRAANDQFMAEVGKTSGLPSGDVKSILDDTIVPNNASILDDLIVPAGAVSILDDTFLPPPGKY